MSERRGPLAKASTLPEPMDLADNPVPDHAELHFPARSPIRDIRVDDVAPAVLEATGIGGVRPADNFAIAVQCRYVLLDEDEDDGKNPAASHLKSLPPSLNTLLTDYHSRKRKACFYDQEFLSIRKRDLAPSALPVPLSFMPFDDDDAGYSDDDDMNPIGDDAISESPESPGAFPPSAAPQPVELPLGDSDASDADEDDNGASADGDSDADASDDDGSLDLLATAREADPEAIRAREREYDANMADRLAEEIPAGSSAATAGGGSGFASPASAVAPEEYARAVKDAWRKGVRVHNKRRSSSSRAGRSSRTGASTTADSMVVQAPRDMVREDGEDGEDGDGDGEEEGSGSGDEAMSDVGS